MLVLFFKFYLQTGKFFLHKKWVRKTPSALKKLRIFQREHYMNCTIKHLLDVYHVSKNLAGPFLPLHLLLAQTDALWNHDARQS